MCISNRMPNRMLESLPVRNARMCCMSNKMPGQMSDRMQEKMSDSMGNISIILFLSFFSFLAKS